MVATIDTATYVGAVANSGTELLHGDDNCLKADQGRDGGVGGDDVEYRLSTPELAIALAARALAGLALAALAIRSISISSLSINSINIS